MKTNQTGTIIIFCVYIIFSRISGSTCSKYRKISHTLPYTTALVQDTRERPSARLVYGACDTNEQVYERNCTLVIETDEPRGSPDHLEFCDVTIRSSSVMMNAVDYLYALDENTTVIHWKYQHYGRFAIVHFPDCRIVYPEIREKWELSLDLIHAANNETFDVIVEDSRNRTFCSRNKWCRMIFYINGSIYEYPRNWVDKREDIIEIVRLSDRIRLVVDMIYGRAERYVRVYKTFENGVFKVLKTYPAYDLHANSQKITVSTTHKLVTVCALNGTQMTCGQFDHKGTLTLETNFKPSDFSKLHSAKVFNRPSGGFIFLHVNFPSNEDNGYYWGEKKFFTITRLNKSTLILKSGTFEQLTCDDGEFDLDKIHVSSDNGDENFCLSHVCDHRGADGRVSTTVECFTRQDLEL